MFSIRSNKSHPLLINSELSNHETHADIWLRGCSGQRFPTHRFILAAVSPMLSSVLCDIPLVSDVCVVIPHSDPATVRLLLEFVYSGEVERCSETEFNDVLRLMKQLGIDHLRRQQQKQRQLHQQKQQHGNGNWRFRVSDTSTNSSDENLVNGGHFVNDLSPQEHNTVEHPILTDEAVASREPDLEDEEEDYDGDMMATQFLSTDFDDDQPQQVSSSYIESEIKIEPDDCGDDEFEGDDDAAAENDPLAAESGGVASGGGGVGGVGGSSGQMVRHFQRPNFNASATMRGVPKSAANSQPILVRVKGADGVVKSGIIRPTPPPKHNKNSLPSSAAAAAVPPEGGNCDLCSASFLTRSSLLKHITMSHTNPSSHTCTRCKFRTTDRSSLRAHVRTVHDHIKNFKCPHCDLRYFRKQHVERHILAAHLQIKPFQCQFCDLSWSRKDRLSEHQRISHPETMAAEETV